jgi:hypothetical protein
MSYIVVDIVIWSFGAVAMATWWIFHGNWVYLSQQPGVFAKVK